MAQISNRGEAPGNRTEAGSSTPSARGTGARRDKASVQAYLDRFSTAMTAGDTRTLAGLWSVPAFVIGENMTRVVQSPAEVEQFFAGAKDMYNARGITSTRAEIVDLDWISDNLVTVRVRWPYLDQHNREHGEESSSYTLQRDDSGELKLRVITLRGELAEGAPRSVEPH
jgi:hypothetical protein